MLPNFFNRASMKPLCLIVAVFILSEFFQESLGHSLVDYRWFKTEEGWCVDVDDSMFCIPFAVSVDTINPGNISFVEVVPDGAVPNRILFTHDGSLGFSGAEKADERVTFVESYELPGAVAKRYLVGSSYVLEMKLANGVRVDLYGPNFDELINVAIMISTSWRKSQ